jgi:hypothetical protein
MQTFSSIVTVLVTLAVIANVQSEYNKLEYTVLSATGADIQHAEITPMPIMNPGEAFLTFTAKLIRPISKFTLHHHFYFSVSHH